MKKKWFICVVLFAVLGCGYHSSPEGEKIDAGIRKVFVDMFSNSTPEANVENYVRNAFFDRLRKGRRFTPVADRNQADAFLTGKIKKITTSHIAYSSTDIAKENRVLMIMEIVFKRSDNGDVIWTKKSLSGREAYTVEYDTAITAANKANAIRKLSVDMADKAYRNMVSGF